MERNVVEIYKSLDAEVKAKVDKVREETEIKLHELAEEHQEAVTKFVEGLSEEEYAEFVISDEASLSDKVIVMMIYDNKKSENQ